MTNPSSFPFPECVCEGHQTWSSAECRLLCLWNPAYKREKWGLSVPAWWRSQGEWKMEVLNSLWPGDAIGWYRCGSTLVQVMAWCLMAPSHYLNQCWLIIKGVLWYSPERWRWVDRLKMEDLSSQRPNLMRSLQPLCWCCKPSPFWLFVQQLFRLTITKTSKLCMGNLMVSDLPHKGPAIRKVFPCY